MAGDETIVLAFKAKRDAERREGLRELTRMTEEFGGYDREFGERARRPR